MKPPLAKSKEELREDFLRLGNEQDIATLLELDYSRLTYHVYGVSNTLKYTTFSIPKKSGGIREIAAPATALKIIQRKLNYILQQVYQPKASTHGFTYNRDILTNARLHCKQRYVLNIDLVDFFPSINFGRVRGMFMSIPYKFNAEVATMLAQICCWNNSLPQGAPTSPVISNMICAKMDSQLQRLAQYLRCIYTRYADDITFSTSMRNFPQPLATAEASSTGDRLQLGRELNRVIQDNGFRVNASKVRLLKNTQRQEVTGLTTNQVPNVKRKYSRKIRAMLHAWETFGLDAAEEEFRNKHDQKHRHPSKSPVSFQQVVRGKIDFLGHVRGKDYPIYVRFLTQLERLAPELVKQSVVVAPSLQMAVSVRTEGITDQKHLTAAFNFFAAQGRFAGLEITFQDSGQDAGRRNLLNFCRYVSTLPYHPKPVICVFDRDEPRILRDVTDKDKLFKEWGNNVFSFALPVPEHRADNAEICIEHYYADSEITRTDENGRRLFLSNEFDSLAGRHRADEQLNCTLFSKLSDTKFSIIDDRVFNAQSTNVALSKNDFADNVLNSGVNFDNFDFSAFGEVFEIIEQIALTRPS